MDTETLQQIPLVVGVTGHRDLVPEEVPAITEQVTRFFTNLTDQFPGLPILVLSGLAEGADMLVSRIAQQVGSQVINVLPMPTSLYEMDFTGENLCAFQDSVKSHETLQLPLLPGTSVESAQAYGENRDLQYERLGAYLAAHSHILLALWDGKYTGAIGGTGQVVDFHQRDVSALAAEQMRSQLDIADDESDLVYHIVCSRASEGHPDASLVAGSASWFTRDVVRPRVDKLPLRYVDVFEKIQAFNRDVSALPDSQTRETLYPQGVAGSTEKSCDAIQSIFSLSDALASHYQKRVFWALRATLISTVLAGLCFIVYADISDQGDFIWGYFLFVGIALGSYWLADKQDWQRRYLDYRVLAEALRVQYYWTIGGVGMPNPSRYSHDSFFQGRDLQLGWIRNVMRVTGLHADTELEPSAAEIAATIEGWVGDENTGQLGYYRSKAGDKLRKHKETGRVSAAAFLFSLLAAGVLASVGSDLSGEVSNWLVAIMGLLPIVAASRQNYAHRVAERELAAQYAHMLNVFENAYRLLQQTETTQGKQMILRDLGEAALHENAQWILRQRERPLPGGDAGT